MFFFCVDALILENTGSNYKNIFVLDCPSIEEGYINQSIIYFVKHRLYNITLRPIGTAQGVKYRADCFSTLVSW